VLPEELQLTVVADVFKAILNQAFHIVRGFRDFADEVFRQVSVQGFVELNVDQSVLDVAVAQEIHDVEDVAHFVLEGGGLPVSQGAKGDAEEFWVSEFVGDSETSSQE
jgi:hypothetical protein